ncbi:MAG: hypothetical protein JSW11_13570 [Candidatus Heimdallarchaeota archaeon]|nr:MAG: hypothetical protein JSW11_13570 [Candidatus Heimdallarchaeota archaeon]
MVDFYENGRILNSPDLRRRKLAIDSIIQSKFNIESVFKEIISVQLEPILLSFE